MKKSVVFIILIIAALMSGFSSVQFDIPEETQENEPDVEIIAERINFPHNHNWVDGKCVVCGAKCIHEWDEGRCLKCKLACDHKKGHDEKTIICNTCGLRVFHKYKSGFCIGCGKRIEFYNDYPEDKYLRKCEQAGEIKDWDVKIGDTGRYKKISVYTPYGYNKDKKYNILFLMAGQYGEHDTWTRKHIYYEDGFNMSDMYDNMFFYGLCEPMIIVSFTDATYYSGEIEYDSFAATERNLINGIMPFVISNYSSYAQGTSREEISAAREHFGMGGYSNGGFNTFYTGLGSMVDVFSNFIPMAGATYPTGIANLINKNFSDYSIDCIYFGCGMDDRFYDICFESYNTLILNVPQIKKGENIWCGWIEGGHNMHSAAKLIFNALQLVFPAK